MSGEVAVLAEATQESSVAFEKIRTIPRMTGLDVAPTVLLLGNGEDFQEAIEEALTRHATVSESGPLSSALPLTMAAAPDLVILLGDGAQQATDVLKTLGDHPLTRSIPVAILLDSSDVTARFEASRRGVTVVERTASADGMARSLATIARNPGHDENTGSFSAASLDDVLSIVRRQLEGGILSVEQEGGEAMRFVLRQGRHIEKAIEEFVDKVRPMVSKEKPLRFDYSPSASGLELLDDDSDRGELDVFQGRRIALIEEDAARADAIAQELRSHGAEVVALNLVGSGIRRARHLDPEIVIIEEKMLAGSAFQTLRAVRHDNRLRWASLLVVREDELIGPEGVRVDRVAGAIKPLVAADDSIERRAREETSFDTRLEGVGPSRLLRALLRSGHGFRVEITHPRVHVVVSIAQGLVAGATARAVEKTEKLAGTTALGALLLIGGGRVRVERRDAPATANIFMPIGTALEAASQESPIAPSIFPAAPGEEGSRTLTQPEALIAELESVLGKIRQSGVLDGAPNAHDTRLKAPRVPAELASPNLHAQEDETARPGRPRRTESAASAAPSTSEAPSVSPAPNVPMAIAGPSTADAATPKKSPIRTSPLAAPKKLRRRPPPPPVRRPAGGAVQAPAASEKTPGAFSKAPISKAPSATSSSPAPDALASSPASAHLSPSAVPPPGAVSSQSVPPSVDASVSATSPQVTPIAHSQAIRNNQNQTLLGIAAALDPSSIAQSADPVLPSTQAHSTQASGSPSSTAPPFDAETEGDSSEVFAFFQELPPPQTNDFSIPEGLDADPLAAFESQPPPPLDSNSGLAPEPLSALSTERVPRASLRPKAGPPEETRRKMLIAGAIAAAVLFVVVLAVVFSGDSETSETSESTSTPHDLSAGSASTAATEGPAQNSNENTQEAAPPSGTHEPGAPETPEPLEIPAAGATGDWEEPGGPLPDNANNQMHIAWNLESASFHRREGRLDIAIERYETTLEYAPRSVRALQGLTVIYLEQEQADAAVETAERLIGTGARNAGNNVLLGDAYMLAGRRQDARQAWATAYRINPRHRGARRRVGR